MLSGKDPPKALPKENPYVGPKPFEYSQTHIFFGREEESRRLASLLISHRAVLLYSASGAGKSSLIQAKLIPDLEHRGCVSLGVIRLVGAEQQSDVKENVFLYNVLSQLPDNCADGTPVAKNLIDYLSNRFPASPDSERRVPVAILVLDQFEELFTSHVDRWHERKPFMEALQSALEACSAGDPTEGRPAGPLVNRVSFRLLISIREEYLAYLDRFNDLLPELKSFRLRLEPLSKAKAREAIARPAEIAGRTFDPVFLDNLVEELARIPIISGADSGLDPTGSENQESTLWSRLTGWRSQFGARPINVEQGNRDQQWIVQGEAIEPVQLQVVCSDLWESATKDVISRDCLPAGWTIEAGLGRFYERAIAYALQPKSAEPKLSFTDWARSGVDNLVSIVRRWSQWLVSPNKQPDYIAEAKLRRWFNRKLITPMGTRAPVLQGYQHTGVPDVVIKRLQQKYLLRTEPRFHVNWLEIAHDRLVGPIVRSNARWLERYSSRRLALASGCALAAIAIGITWFQASRTYALPRDVREQVARNLVRVQPELAPLIVAYNSARASETEKETEAQPTLPYSTFRDPLANQPWLQALIRMSGTQAVLPAKGGFVLVGANGEVKHWPPGADAATMVSEARSLFDKCGRGLKQYHSSSLFVLAAGSPDGFEICTNQGPQPLIRKSTDRLPRQLALSTTSPQAFLTECGSLVCEHAFWTDGSLGTWTNTPLKGSPRYAIVRHTAVGPDKIAVLLCEGTEESCDSKILVFRKSGMNAALQAEAIESVIPLSSSDASEVVSLAISGENLAIAYDRPSSGGRVTVIPLPFQPPRNVWLPTGMRNFPLPFMTPKHLTFDLSGRFLSASGDDLAVMWELQNGIFELKPIFNAKLPETRTLNDFALFDRGTVIAVASGIVSTALPSSTDLEQPCFSIWRLDRPSQEKNEALSASEQTEVFSASCADAWQGFAGRSWSQLSGDARGTLLVANGFTFSAGPVEPLVVTTDTQGRLERAQLSQSAGMRPGRFGGTAVNKSGKQLAIGDEQGRVWIVSRGEANTPFKKEEFAAIEADCVRTRAFNSSIKIVALAFNPVNESELTVADQDGCVARWQQVTEAGQTPFWKRLWVREVGFNATAMSYSPDGAWLAVATQDGRVFAFHKNAADISITVPTRLPWIGSVTWMADRGGQAPYLLVINSRNGPVTIWKLGTRFSDAPSEVLPPTSLHPRGVASTDFVDNRLIVAISDGTIAEVKGASAVGDIRKLLIAKACSISADARIQPANYWSSAVRRAWEETRKAVPGLALEAPSELLEEYERIRQWPGCISARY